MMVQLGNRDYTCLCENDLEHLKNTIAFALYGPPQNLNGYDEKKSKFVN